MLWQQILSLGWVQWLAFITGLLYIFYANRDNAACWPWGILSSALWAYASWFDLKLLSDSLLQIAYIVLGITGWYRWIHKTNTPILSITRLNTKEWFLYISSCIFFSFLLGKIMQQTQAAYPMIDAYISAFSIGATILLVNKKIENWIWWLLIDLLNIPLFIARQGYLFALLFFIYALLAIKGWYDWKKIMLSKPM